MALERDNGDERRARVDWLIIEATNSLTKITRQSSISGPLRAQLVETIRALSTVRSDELTSRQR
jgi:hypothetical protein